MARQKGAEEVIECPICSSRVKAKNLVRHYDKTHKGAEVPASVGRKSASSSKSTSIAASGSCPKCGFSYKWSGSSCGHCGYGGGGRA